MLNVEISKGVGTVAEVLVLAATLLHAAKHYFSLKIYNSSVIFMSNCRHYMDVCTNGNGSKPMTINCFKPR